MQLRPYQAAVEANIYNAWESHRNVLAVLPTGAGKTVLFSKILRDHDAPACAIAHRQELVSQISIALARDKVKHKIIGPEDVIRNIIKLQYDEVGGNYVNANAHVGVAGVDTLTSKKRIASLRDWINKSTLWVTDEGHHMLRKNKWGKAAQLFTNAKGLGVTATPTRADGEGLGHHADGLINVMVEGPGQRELINMGYLTDYRIFCPPSDLDLSNVETGSTGDFKKPQVTKAVRKSHITGDVVEHYLRIAPGKLGVTFATDVESAKEISAKFNAAGVPAAVVTANTPDTERAAILRQFKNRQLLQLVNVDLFGEGFDLPALEVVSMARPTQSLSLFIQQFGRALRVMISPILAAAWDTFTDEQRRAHIAASEKPYAIIIDHVGNIIRHNLPDAPRIWTLDRREKQSRGKINDDVIPLRECLNIECMGVYERTKVVCPLCGNYPEPGSRSAPEFVDGDLMELDPLVLAQMRGEIERVDISPEQYAADLTAKHAPYMGVIAHTKRHVKRQEGQAALRASISWWAGKQRAQGVSDQESYRVFYHIFKMDVLTAQTLNYDDALELADRINERLVK